MRNLNNSETTIAIRLRTLKAVYNRLVKIGQMPSSSNPFNDYVIKNRNRSYCIQTRVQYMLPWLIMN